MLIVRMFLLLRSYLGAARRALHCSYGGPSRAGASARRGVTAPTRMYGSAKPMRELQNLLPRADHTREVRRSNAVLTDEGGPQGGGSYPLNASL
jgi:hypothetical protein